MLLRRAVPVTLAAAALAACQPSVPERTNPRSIDYVVFDPSSSQIPLPNDLARQQSAIDAATGAQKEFLQLNQAGFFNDQTLPVTIDVQRFTLGPGAPAKGPPPEAVDLATLTTLTLLVLDTDLATGVTAPFDTSAGLEKKYSVAPSADRGRLNLRPAPDSSGSRRWKPNHLYAVVLRGGESGVKLAGGGVLTAMPTTYLLTRGVDLSLPENQYLLPGDGRQERAATGQQLEALRQSYLPLFAAAEQAWGAGAAKEIASVQTFKIAQSAGTAVTIDAVLPSDALLDSTTGKVSLATATDAFCDWKSLDALGSCALAEGLSTLDGFSTTAMWLVGSTGAFKASTVTGDSVLLYEVTASGPTRVLDLGGGAAARYVTQPLPPAASCPGGTPDCVPVIGLQPAVTAGPLFLPPFKEGTQYAVLVTSRVKDVAGNPLVRNNFTKLLFFQNPLADLATEKSNVSALTDAQAVSLEKLRSQLLPLLLARASADKGVTPEEVVMAFSVKTQSITGTALELAAAPYASAAAFVPGTPVDITAAYPGALPPATFQELLSVPVPTLDPIDRTTGAFNPDPTAWAPAALDAVVVVPQAASVAPSCPAPSEALKCAPLVVFQHGITRNKTDVLALASTFASAGFVVAADRLPLHGNRAYCTADAQCVCDEIGAAGFLGAPGTCTPACGFFGPAGLQGDAVQIGQCTGGSVAASTGGALGTGVSGAFLVTQNLFRTRDALRQDVLDNSALILALAPPAPTANPLATRLADQGIAIDGARVYWIGQSLGGIQGVLNVAANPRLSRAVLNAPGAPVADVITQSPAFASAVNALLASLPPPLGPISVGTPQYLQFIQVAKWILDPSEPANFAGHVTADTLADPLASAPAAQAAKDVFGQYAECDQTIPNAFSLYLFGVLGLSSNSAPNPFTKYTIAGAGTPGACTPPASNPAHGFLLDFSDAAKTATAQADAAAYLADLTSPTADR